MINITIQGRPITKKNSQRIFQKYVGGKKIPFIMPSKAFVDYQESCIEYLNKYKRLQIDRRVNVKCVYYMPTRRKVDLLNLMSATCDIFVHYGILVDDNSSIVIGHDGSRVLYDKDNPRAEITISDEADIKDFATYPNKC